jgi:hypothetical protein
MRLNGCLPAWFSSSTQPVFFYNKTARIPYFVDFVLLPVINNQTVN